LAIVSRFNPRSFATAATAPKMPLIAVQGAQGDPPDRNCDAPRQAAAARGASLRQAAAVPNRACRQSFATIVSARGRV
jgi:hypothetical protein